MEKVKFPTIKNVEKELKNIKRFDLDPDISELDITLTWLDKQTGNNDWTIQIGCNEYMGSAYFYEYWAVGVLDRRTNCHELSKDLINQLKDLYYQ
jgi:hypothetical protein